MFMICKTQLLMCQISQTDLQIPHNFIQNLNRNFYKQVDSKIFMKRQKN